MQHLLRCVVALASLVSLVPLASGAPAAAPAHYSFRIKTVSKSGAVAFAPVGEVTRAADGTVTAKGIAIPAFDKLADKLVADWEHYKIPDSIDIVRYLPNGSYMRNSTTKRTVTFTPKDALFKAAVLARFLEARELDALGMSSIDFIIHDVDGGKSTPGVVVNDGGASFTNFRKNTELHFNDGHLSFFISASVRPPVAGAPGPVSQSDKKLALAKEYDKGSVLIAWIDLAADGSVTIHPHHTAELFESQFTSTLAADSISIAVYDGGEYRYVAVAKTEKRFFEAAIVSVMESNGYDVTPAIDPVVFR